MFAPYMTQDGLQESLFFNALHIASQRSVTTGLALCHQQTSALLPADGGTDAANAPPTYPHPLGYERQK